MATRKPPKSTKLPKRTVHAATKPVAKRKFGNLKGLAKIGPEFFEPLPEEELKLWNGDE